MLVLSRMFRDRCPLAPFYRLPRCPLPFPISPHDVERYVAGPLSATLRPRQARLSASGGRTLPHMTSGKDSCVCPLKGLENRLLCNSTRPPCSWYLNESQDTRTFGMDGTACRSKK
eukprot:TRINITY_DN17243_c0_g1_i1.p3 TRINITY_DN17243_c0_g1~~TRINITY_DN17243_c0_g1_i1.p3  ORF type:complete len:116 (-),score=0.73 TRINITY_DN17243_c0_g1_i1:373-720(-)